jgi:hypothetical protein
MLNESVLWFKRTGCITFANIAGLQMMMSVMEHIHGFARNRKHSSQVASGSSRTEVTCVWKLGDYVKK